MYVENHTKIAIFSHPVYLTPPLKGFPLELCIGAGVSRNYNDGAFRRSKNFQIGLAVLIQYRRVTDTRPPTQTRCRSKDTAYYVARVKQSVSLISAD